MRKDGLSWLKHSFCAVSEAMCSCQSSSCATLGVGCADTYGSQLNGDQTGLGPRYEINAATGEFPYPFDTLGLVGPPLYKRVQVAQSDLNPAFNPGATYFYESQYIHPEEPAFGTQYNNVSHREFSVGTLESDGYVLQPEGSTVQEQAAIAAWRQRGAVQPLAWAAGTLARSSMASAASWRDTGKRSFLPFLSRK